MIYALVAVCFTAVVFGWRYTALRRELNRLTSFISKTDLTQGNTLLTLENNEKAVHALVAAVNGQVAHFRENARLAERTELETHQTIAHLSHDLRTPLTSLTGYLQLINPDSLNAQTRKYVGIAAAKAQILTALVEELNSSHAYAPEALDLAALLSDILTGYVDEIERALGEPGIIFTGNTTTIGDRVFFDRIFRNIIQNALRYGCAPFSITASADGGQVKLCFRNGVPAGSGAHPHPEGYGLGLGVVERLMNKMGGSASFTFNKNGFTANIMIQSFPK